MKNFITLLVVYMISFPLSAEIDRCQDSDPSQAKFICGQCEKKDVEWLFGNDMGFEGPSDKNRTDFTNGFLADLANANKTIVTNSEGRKIKTNELASVEDFVSFLPEKFKRDVAFIAPSRSLQEGDRYLLKSPNSEIIMSFNSHPDKDGDATKLRGGTAVEVQVWNGAKAVWEYVEIDFSKGKPTVSRNPEKCLRCHGHGTNTRPNFDPYNFWAETKPFFKDRLIPGTQEAADYVAFLERIKKDSDLYDAGKGPKTRYSILSEMLKVNSLEKIKERLAKNQMFQLEVNMSSGFNSNVDGGQTVNIFDQMYYTNHCRIANLTTNPKLNPLANQMKYALAGAVKGCYRSEEDLAKALPADYMANAKKFFATKGYGKGDFNDLYKETEERQRDYYEDRIGRKLWTMEAEQLRFIQNSPQYAKDLKAAGADPKKIYDVEIQSEKEAYKRAKKQMEILSDNADQVRDKEVSVNNVTPMRFLLEPAGVDTSMLSISVDPLSYTFGDFFFNLGKFGAYKELQSKSCEELNKLSKQAFASPEGVAALSKINAVCKVDAPGVLDPAWKKSLNDIEKAVMFQKQDDLRPKVAEIFKDSCSGCHGSGAMGAPHIPFGDIKKMDSMFSKQAGELGNMQTRIWKRIKRHEDIRGAMPMLGGQLSQQELDEVKEYMDSFGKREYVNPIKLTPDRNQIENVNVPK